MSEKLVYANTDHTLHVSKGVDSTQFGSFEIVEGYNLIAGQTYPLIELAKYQQEAIEAGQVPGLELLTFKEVGSRAKEREKLEALVSGKPAPKELKAEEVVGNVVSDDVLDTVDLDAAKEPVIELESGGEKPAVSKK